VQALIHPPPPRQDGPLSAQHVGVAPASELIGLLRLSLQVLTGMNLSIATCPLPFSMVSKDAPHLILNGQLNDQCNSQVSC